MHVPNLADLEELRLRAEEILQPGPGQRVLILISDIEAEVDDDNVVEEAIDNVHPLHGGPVMTGEEVRLEERQTTAEVLEALADRARRGEIRHLAAIVGAEENTRGIALVETVITPGIEDHLAVFLGGGALLQRHLMDVHEEMAMDSMGEFD